MSTRELARTLLDEMPDNDLIYLVAYMQSLKALKDAEIPNSPAARCRFYNLS